MTSPAHSPVATMSPQTLLLEGCQFCISQCELLLGVLTPEDFTAGENGASVGTHLRHVIERFQSFFNGLPASSIDYDERKRDLSISNNPEAANFAFASIRKRLESLKDCDPALPLGSVQELVLLSGTPVNISSTLGRELLGLISRTTHHLAIVALLAKSMGYKLDRDFGKAPSTIRHERAGQLA